MVFNRIAKSSFISSKSNQLFNLRNISWKNRKNFLKMKMKQILS